MQALTAKDFESEILRQWREAEVSGLAMYRFELEICTAGWEGTRDRRIECQSAATS